MQQAWTAANAALVASGDQQAMAAQKANQAISDLDAQINGLKQSYVVAKAPKNSWASWSSRPARKSLR